MFVAIIRAKKYRYGPRFMQIADNPQECMAHPEYPRNTGLQALAGVRKWVFSEGKF